MSKSACTPLQILITEDSFKIKTIFFVKYYNKNFRFVILHKLVKFHYQTVFTFQVIQQNRFHISPEKLQSDYSKNKKRFQSEIKNIFPCFTSAFT